MKHDERKREARRAGFPRRGAAAALAATVLVGWGTPARAGEDTLPVPGPNDLSRGVCIIIDYDRGPADALTSAGKPWESFERFAAAHARQTILARTRSFDHAGGGPAAFLSRALAAQADEVARGFARRLGVQVDRLSAEGRGAGWADAEALDKVERAARVAAQGALNDWSRRLSARIAVVNPGLAQVLSVRGPAQLSALSAAIAASIRAALEDELSLPRRPEDSLTRR